MSFGAAPTSDQSITLPLISNQETTTTLLAEVVDTVNAVLVKNTDKTAVENIKPTMAIAKLSLTAWTDETPWWEIVRMMCGGVQALPPYKEGHYPCETWAHVTGYNGRDLNGAPMEMEKR